MLARSDFYLLTSPKLACSGQRVLLKANQNALYDLTPLFSVSCLKMPINASGKRVLRRKVVEQILKVGNYLSSFSVNFFAIRRKCHVSLNSLCQSFSLYFQSMFTSPRSPNMLSLGFGSCWPLMTWEKESETGMFRLNKSVSVYTVYWLIASATAAQWLTMILHIFLLTPVISFLVMGSNFGSTICTQRNYLK